MEFSSPNVAKPFHMGHLRSTIIGNFVANIHQSVGHSVTRLNWLGDWGTQFGLLTYGLTHLDQKRHQKDLDLGPGSDPLRQLYNIYVSVNQEAEAKPEIAAEARKLFALLEQGDEGLLKQWAQIRSVTIQALEQVYQKLGIVFDHYHGEAMYGTAKFKAQVLDALTDKGLLQTLEDGRQVIDLNPQRRIIVSKSDGSSLYITRDIAAALDRLKSINPDKMVYVVENGQSNHFKNLFDIIAHLEPDSNCHLQHVIFGRISGMSTRKGTAVFLSDILQEATERMIEKMKATNTTKVDPNELEACAEVLGISGDFKTSKSSCQKL